MRNKTIGQLDAWASSTAFVSNSHFTGFWLVRSRLRRNEENDLISTKKHKPVWVRAPKLYFGLGASTVETSPSRASANFAISSPRQPRYGGRLWRVCPRTRDLV